MLVAEMITKSSWRKLMPEFERLAGMLVMPFVQNHMPRHPALGPVVAEELKKLAPVYRLDQPSYEAAVQIMQSSRRMEHAFNHCRAPHPRMFLEFPDSTSGFMIEGDRDDCLISWFVGDRLCWQVRGNFDDPLGAKTTEYGPSLQNVHVSALWHTAAIWMYLTITGATVVEKKLTRDGRIARNRRKPFALGAIDSYNQVRLLIPDRQYQRASTQLRHGPGVRQHDVVGHWREISVNDGGKMLRWIAAYWRGNPKLGVIIKARNVTTRRSPKHDLPPPMMESANE
jgi:hypothetical protein